VCTGNFHYAVEREEMQLAFFKSKMTKAYILLGGENAAAAIIESDAFKFVGPAKNLS
jgi:hypothetical protein